MTVNRGRRLPKGESVGEVVGDLPGIPTVPDKQLEAPRGAYVDAMQQRVPGLAALFETVVPELAKKPLSQRSTDELILQIDSGRFVVEIARLWSVPLSELNRWIAANAGRSAREKLARKSQAALWDWMALQVLLQAPGDRVEMTRAERIAQHCRWRAEALSREDYARKLKAAEVDERDPAELTTRELEMIARGDGVLD